MKGGAFLDDAKIIELYNNRDESALFETDAKYGGFCFTIAFNILNDKPDSEECVNDTWHKAWNSIPPAKPLNFKGFLGRITRNLALDRYKYFHRQKRGGNETELALEELGVAASDYRSAEDEVLLKELGKQISVFLDNISERDRNIFIARYYFVYSVSEIACRLSLDEKYVSNILSRTRARLKKFLSKAGYEV